MRLPARHLRLLLFAAVTILIPSLLLAACASSDSAEVLAIKQPLPDQESLVYTLRDDRSTAIGTASIGIAKQGDALLLSQKYTDKDGHIDEGTVTVDAATLKPRGAHREVLTTAVQTALEVTYADKQVSSAVTISGKPKQHTAAIGTGTYDDQESFFLLRTLDFTAGYSTHFAIVVVDVAKGTISRALGTAKVVGQANLKVSGQQFRAWRVELTGAGATNIAWFDSAPGRRLLRYDNSRQTYIELTNP